MESSAKVPLKQSGKSFSVSGLIACHFMDGVMDRIKIESFSAFCKVGLAHGCAVLGFHTHLKVLLGGIGDDFG